jgi:hypothetical protein
LKYNNTDISVALNSLISMSRDYESDELEIIMDPMNERES